MKDKFIDTNLLVYLFSDDKKASSVNALIKKHFSSILISSQVLGELFNVLTRKNIRTSSEARNIVEELVRHFEVAPVRSDTVIHAMRINEATGFSYWDSLVVATALDNFILKTFNTDR